ncbi:carbohydrate kinase family protein [Streptomyces sp. NPDC005355]|uniref:carbohydrate kinase family protein n=1 Tax=Streptomyces sp. NPDC005355 TaxID=3157038 RepID=UPI0033A5EB91
MNAYVQHPSQSDRITVIGNVNLDVLMADVSSLPPPGTEWTVPSIVLRPGGSAANTAIALARLGRPTVLVGRIGDDGTARLLADQLDIPGLRTHLARAAGEHTGVTVAAEAPGRDRAFLSALGALAQLDATVVPAETLSARFVLLTGYFLLPRIQGRPARDLLCAAQREGAGTALDTGWNPDGWPVPARADLLRLLEQVDVFLPNSDEVCALTGGERTDDEAAARLVAEHTGTTIVVKRGARGALVVPPEGPVTECSTPQVQVRDSTGAGDAFNAGLLDRLADGVSLANAADYATRVAATVISRASYDRAFSPEDVLSGEHDPAAGAR